MPNAKTPRPTQSRKLLVAAIGVATVNYLAVGCGKTNVTSGNLPAPHEPDAGYPVVGNLPAPEPVDAAPPPPPPEAGTIPPTSGNLPAPIPRDAGTTKKKK